MDGKPGEQLEHSMEELYQQYAQTVYRFLLAQTRDKDLSEDLMQETFCQAIGSVHRFRGGCKVSVWLCQIARHLWYRQLKRRKQELDVQMEAVGLYSLSAEEEALARVEGGRLLQRLREMEGPVREVLRLRLAGGMSFREIGELTGHTEVWARVTFYRGKQRLMMEEYRDEG